MSSDEIEKSIRINNVEFKSRPSDRWAKEMKWKIASWYLIGPFDSCSSLCEPSALCIVSTLYAYQCFPSIYTGATYRQFCWDQFSFPLKKNNAVINNAFLCSRPRLIRRLEDLEGVEGPKELRYSVTYMSSTAHALNQDLLWDVELYRTDQIACSQYIVQDNHLPKSVPPVTSRSKSQSILYQEKAKREVDQCSLRPSSTLNL